MITTISILLALISLFAVFTPETPIGKYISKLTFISNANFKIAYPLYKKIVLRIYLFIGIFHIYVLIWLNDFFTHFSILFASLWQTLWQVFFFIFLFKWFPNSSQNNRKLQKQLFTLGKKFVIYFSTFMICSFIFANYFKYEIDKGQMENIYQEVINDKNTGTWLSILPNSTLLERKNIYDREINIIARINMINQYKEKYGFEYDLSPNKYEENKPYSDLINETKIIYNSNTYTDKFSKEIEKAPNKTRKTPIYVFPVEIQGLYVANKIISINSDYFASLAVGSKVYIMNIFRIMIGNLGIVGLGYSIFPLLLLSAWLTLKVSAYNRKYSGTNTENSYFFIMVTVFSLFFAVLSSL